ncbi:hypothetical protein ACFY4B_27560 [Kitasatospora sp. NPDC001261]|uniref:hypothetical protein n=1 Tax=Kitasatospora sp. NPDC001261 TaxID=3364012 RepID=UPI0036B6106E
MTSSTNEQNLSRKLKLRERHKQQASAADAIDTAEKKVAAAKLDMAKAVQQAVDAFGSQQAVEEQLEISVKEQREYLELLAAVESDGKGKSSAPAAAAAKGAAAPAAA